MLPWKTGITILSLLILILLISVGRVPTARADFYKFTDSSGTVCITNDRNAVPPKYRAAMKVVREELQENKDPGARKQALHQAPQASGYNSAISSEQTPVPAAETTSRTESLTKRFPFFKPLVIIAGIGVLFLIVSKIASLLPSPQLSRLIYVSFFLVVSIFGFKLYAESMTNNYRTIKTKVIAMFIKANERQAPETVEKALENSQNGQSLNGVIDKEN